MTDRELMKQALDALEYSVPSGYGPTELYDDAIDALRSRLEQPEQEPVAWELNEVILNSIRDSSEVVAPPQREWQGLTDGEIVELAGGGITRDERMIARAIEAKLKEKNSR